MLIATDLDGTFLAGDPGKRRQLYDLIGSHPGIQLVFVTGRGVEAVMPVLSDPRIPQPDYLICDVGCTIINGSTMQPVYELQSEIDAIWPGDLQIENALAGVPGLVRQDVPQERRCSFFCEQTAVTGEVERIIAELGCDLLFSAGMYLDVLPKGVNKGSTLRRLIQHLEVSESDVLTAGDTLNDLSMLNGEFLGVCVGGSEPGLIRATADISKVLHARSAGCGGILEAFSRYGFIGELGIEASTRTELNPGRSDLVIAYHRFPFEEYVSDGQLKRRAHASPNGIMPTLLGFFADGRSGSWVAWTVTDGLKDKPGQRFAIDSDRYPNLDASRVLLTQEDRDIFYKRFSKEAFWPTLHTFWERAEFRADHWDVYCKVNRAFAETVAREAAANALVWVHDYNLWMVPAYLRELRPDLNICFFHHTYFPSSDVFNVVPWRRDIIGSLMQCDYIGFHIPRQAENFVDVARGVMPIETLERKSAAPRFLTFGCAVGLEEMTSRIAVNGRVVGLGAHPVGLDLDRVRNALAAPDTQSRINEIRARNEGLRIILSVERLDYTKGTLEKLVAYEKLLDQYPQLRGKISLVVICVPAANNMQVYQALQTDIEQAVGRINGRFSQVGWTPLQFFFRAVPFPRLVAHYACADVMWITPLRDGLNLVAKEYVATQGMIDGSGVLVLSEFAGAAAELRGAVLTNPHDPGDMVATCHWALEMDAAEARARIREAYSIVEHYDVSRWGEEFFAAAEQPA